MRFWLIAACLALGSCVSMGTTFAKPQVVRDIPTWADKAAGSYLIAEACNSFHINRDACRKFVIAAALTDELIQIRPCMLGEWCPRWYDRVMDVAVPITVFDFAYRYTIGTR